MLRQIISPTGTSLTLTLPQEMVGKTVEVIAFELSDSQTETKRPEASERLKQIRKITEHSKVDLSKYKFNRDDANNYDE